MKRSKPDGSPSPRVESARRRDDPAGDAPSPAAPASAFFQLRGWRTLTLPGRPDPRPAKIPGGVAKTALLLLLVLACAPAFAQSAGQIARARAGASCPRCNLFQADFGGARLIGRSFAGARLRQADLSASVMNHTSFAGADLRDVNAYGGVFSGADFSRANLTHASFVGTYLEGANLSGARLDGANLSGAEMARARGLTQRQLDSACGDSTTTLPPGLHVASCR